MIQAECTLFITLDFFFINAAQAQNEKGQKIGLLLQTTKRPYQEQQSNDLFLTSVIHTHCKWWKKLFKTNLIWCGWHAKILGFNFTAGDEWGLGMDQKRAAWTLWAVGLFPCESCCKEQSIVSRDCAVVTRRLQVQIPELPEKSCWLLWKTLNLKM